MYKLPLAILLALFTCTLKSQTKREFVTKECTIYHLDTKKYDYYSYNCWILIDEEKNQITVRVGDELPVLYRYNGAHSSSDNPNIITYFIKNSVYEFFILDLEKGIMGAMLYESNPDKEITYFNALQQLK